MPQNTHDVLGGLVSLVKCKPGWRFHLIDEADEGLRLRITVTGPNSRADGEKITIWHDFPVPMATYNEKTWRRWIFECCRGVENHELGEFFMLNGERPFAPLHSPGNDPYMVHEFRPELDALMTQDGTVRRD